MSFCGFVRGLNMIIRSFDPETARSIRLAIDYWRSLPEYELTDVLSINNFYHWATINYSLTRDSQNNLIFATDHLATLFFLKFS